MKLQMYQVLGYLTCYDSLQDQKIEIGLAYKLTKIANALYDDKNFYDNKVAEIILKYGERDDKGDLVPLDNNDGYKIEKGKLAECQKEMGELLNLEINTQFDSDLEIEQLGSLDISMKELKCLMPFIK